MSGIETAGLVLAILPLLVNQLDNYVQGLQAIKSFRTRKYRAEFESYLTTLETQQVAFLDTLEHALEDVVDHEEEVSDFIYNPRGSLWSDEIFQTKLRKKLGRGYSPFVKTIKELANLLEHLANELGLDPSKQDVSHTHLTLPEIKLT